MRKTLSAYTIACLTFYHAKYLIYQSCLTRSQSNYVQSNRRFILDNFVDDIHVFHSCTNMYYYCLCRAHRERTYLHQVRGNLHHSE